MASGLLFATRQSTPFSGNTFRTRVWSGSRPSRSGVDFPVCVHDLRHVSWLLGGGSDLKSVTDRMGHAQITTRTNTHGASTDADGQTGQAD